MLTKATYSKVIGLLNTKNTFQIKGMVENAGCGMRDTGSVQNAGCGKCGIHILKKESYTNKAHVCLKIAHSRVFSLQPTSGFCSFFYIFCFCIALTTDKGGIFLGMELFMCDHKAL